MPEINQGKRAVKSAVSFTRSTLSILVFVILVALTTVALRPLQQKLVDRMEQSRDELLVRIEAVLGRRIEYSAMGPSILGVLDIRDIRVLRDDDSILLSISRLRLSYSLFALLRGDIANSFHSARIDHPVLNFDQALDSDLGDRLASRNNEEIQPPSNENGAISATALSPLDLVNSLIPASFTFRIWNGQWNFSSAGTSFALRGVDLSASAHQAKLDFQGRWNASLDLDNALGISDFKAELGTQVRGEYLRDSAEGNATVAISSFTGTNFRLNPISFSFFFSNQQLEGRKTHDRLPLAASFAYDFAAQRFQANLEGEHFSLLDMLVLSGSWQDFNTALAAQISGHASFEKEAESAPRFDIDLSSMLTGLFTETANTDDDTLSEKPPTLAVKAFGDGSIINIETLHFSSPKGVFDFQGGMDIDTLAPYGTLTLADFRRTDVAGISGNFTLATSGREITLSSRRFTAGTSAFPRFEVRFFREDSGFSVRLAAENAHKARALFESFFDNDPRQVRASLTLNAFPAGDILNIANPFLSRPLIPAPVQLAMADTMLDIDAFFTTNFDQFLYNVPRLSISGTGGVTVDASFSGSERRFELSPSSLSWNGERLDLSASADFVDVHDIPFSVRAAHRNLAYFFSGIIAREQGINVSGSYGFMLNVRNTGNGSFEGYAQGTDIPFISGTRTASLSFLSSIFYQSPASWRVSMQDFELSNLSSPSSSSASLRFSGTATERGLNIPALAFSDGIGPLEGSVSADWTPDFSQVRFMTRVYSGDHAEVYDANGEYRDEYPRQFALGFQGAGMRAARIFPYDAAIDAGFRLSWVEGRSIDAQAEVSSLTWTMGQETLTASASARINNSVLRFDNIQAAYAGIEAWLPYVEVNRAAATAEASGLIQGIIDSRPLDIVFNSQSVFAANTNWFDLLNRLDHFDSTLTVETARFDDLQAEEAFSFLVSSRPQNGSALFTVSGGPQNMLRATYSPGSDGKVFAALSAPFPVRGSFTGSIGDGNIDIHSPDLYVDMASFWQFMPRDIVVAFPSGIVTASLRIAGPLDDPSFFGTALATSVHIALPEYLPEPIRPAPVQFTLTGEQMTFGPIDSVVGGGAGSASAWFRFERWIPNIFEIDITVPHETPIPYDINIAGVLANGLASGNLVVAMEDSQLSLSGDLVAHSTIISINSEELVGGVSRRRGNSGETLAEMRITAGRRVEFIWPNQITPWLQATADRGGQIRISSDSSSNSFTLTGNLALRGGELLWLERNFILREGSLTFNESESSFNPTISARAEIREVSEEGPTTISLIVDNAPLRDFTPRFIASPPLSQMEIFTLLGQTPQGDGSQRNLAAAVALDGITQFALMRNVQRRIRDFLGLDMFSLRTQFLRNLLIQQDGDGGTVTDIERTNWFGNFFDNTTVFAGRYFGSSVFGQGMLSMRYNQSNMLQGEILWEPELGIEMRTPLIDANFSLMPQQLGSGFIGINDISFSVIWRKTF